MYKNWSSKKVYFETINAISMPIEKKHKHNLCGSLTIIVKKPPRVHW